MIELKFYDYVLFSFALYALEHDPENNLSFTSNTGIEGEYSIFVKCERHRIDFLNCLGKGEFDVLSECNITEHENIQ